MTREPASSCAGASSIGASRLVGDPVDIVTGALIDTETDIRLPKAGFAWVRRFDSRELSRDRGLGFGFRHALDHELRFDIDGMTYEDDAWGSTSFPFLKRDGERCVRGALTLERRTALSFRLHAAGRLRQRYDFKFESAHEPARLELVKEREHALSLYYERFAGKRQLSAVGLGRLGRLQLEWSQARIVRLVLHQTEPERETELAAYRYDERGCLMEVRNAYKHNMRYVFDAQRRMTRKSDWRGFAFVFAYDAEGRCISSRGEDGAEAVELEYRPIERTTIVTRHDGGKWQYQYNADNVITNILDPLGGMRAWVVDDRGRVSEEVDAVGNVTTFEYDQHDVATHKRDPFGYDLPLGNAAGDEIDHPLLHRVAATALEYEHGELFAPPERLPAADTPLWQVPVEARGSLQTADPEWGGQTRFEDNLQGLALRDHREGGKVRRWAYDENANTRWQIDFDGRKHGFEYSSDNHLTRVVDPSGRVTRLEYSATEELTALTDAGGTRSEFVLDLKDRIKEVRRHGKVRERYAYDLADNLVEKRDANGELLLELTIGPGNLPVARKIGGAEVQTYNYDEGGRLIEARGDAGTCTFSYDASGLRTSDVRDELGVVREATQPRSWNTSVFGVFVTQYTHSLDGALRVTDPTGRVHHVRQLSPGIVERQFANGIREVMQYDLTGLCLAKTLYRRRGDDQPWVRSFHYSAEADLLERRDSERGTMRYAYDASHRLQRAVHADGSVDEYEYDAADNLLRLPSDGPERITWLQVQSGNRLARAGSQSFAYDDRDHIVRRERLWGTVHYRRDAADQLTEIKAPEYQFRAKYDPLGRRTEKTVDGLTTQSYWDSDRLIAEIYPDGSVRVYVYADALALVPMMFVHYASVDAAPDSGRRFYVVGDQLGAVELVLNDHGEPAWQARLDPYGLARITVGKQFPQPLRFPGHFYDAETGLHYNRFRYYDPSLGRYLESDPLGIEGGINLYAYTWCPLSDVDVRGERRKCPLCLLEPGETKATKKDREGNDVEVTRTARRVDDNDSYSDGRKPPAGTTKVTYDDGSGRKAVFYLDDKGRTIRAEVPVVPPKGKYEKEGYHHDLDERVSGRDDRGHLGAESLTESYYANTDENVIAEHGTESNRSVKKRWENQTRKEVGTDSNSYTMVHEPQYDGDDARPSSVNHNLTKNGEPVDGFEQSIDNPT